MEPVVTATRTTYYGPYPFCENVTTTEMDIKLRYSTSKWNYMILSREQSTNTYRMCVNEYCKSAK